MRSHDKASRWLSCFPLFFTFKIVWNSQHFKKKKEDIAAVNMYRRKLTSDHSKFVIDLQETSRTRRIGILG